MANRRLALAAGALALLVSCCVLSQRAGSAVELSSGGRAGVNSHHGARGVNSNQMASFAEGLVGKNLPVENLATPYETGFPRVTTLSLRKPGPHNS